MEIDGSYDPVLVGLSVAVAVFASFTALNLAGRLLAADNHSRPWWLLAAALALGGGIWSMHFVGMLAFRMPMVVAYDVRLTLLSLILPIGVVGAGLHTVSRFGNQWRPLLAAGVLAGLGVVVMHYVGMAAMRMPGGDISYDPLLVGASIVIAIVAATAAFWLAFRTTRTWERLAAAVVMGLAIAGMHYTAMAAATFKMSGHTHRAVSVIEPGLLGVAVVGASAILLLLALLTAFFDRKLATLTAREAEALRASEERLRSLVRHASDIVTILDRDGTVLYEGSSAWYILGYRTKELVGRPLSAFASPEQTEPFQQFIEKLLQLPGGLASTELSLRHNDGSWRIFEAIGKNLLHEPAVAGIVMNLRDVTERKRLMAELERLSESDALTGTLNRRGFLKIAEREFKRARRLSRSLSIVLLDIDHFKAVNDRFGHAAGDMVLATVADCCRKHIRDMDVLARYGGEEFIFLLVDASLEDAQKIVTRLKERIAECRVNTIKGEVSVTASFGLACINSNTTEVETAIRLADEALYEAKNAGRNCIRIRASA
jgi:diguanylate cyclase (GGDEF)-like protein/PAS domain S-box-containing protein